MAVGAIHPYPRGSATTKEATGAIDDTPPTGAAARPREATEHDPWILRSILHCGVCDAPMRAEIDDSRRAYVCSGCPRSVDAERVETQAWHRFARSNELVSGAVAPQQRGEALRRVVRRVTAGDGVRFEWRD